MAVGEGNYGRLGPNQQQRFTTANRRLQLPDFDEQPGAMPEIAPSPDYSPTGSIDRKFTERAMVMQAWGNYGTAWPVVHQQLGVRPDAGRGFLEVVPQVPGDKPIGGSAIRLGQRGKAAVRASRSGKTYTTRVQVGAPISKLAIGHTLPAGATVRKAPARRRAGDAGDPGHEPRARGHGRDGRGDAHAGGDGGLSMGTRWRPKRSVQSTRSPARIVIAPQPRSRAVQAGPRSPIANAAVA